MIIIDHIFIFTADNGKVADELIQLGLIEGSNRIHVGQGTSNTKIYFENFFLEVLWVNNENEILNNKIKDTGLWDRSKFYQNDFSPFGLCIFNNEDSNKIFENSLKYQPDYFPKGMTIDIVNNEDNPALPWTFRLPFKELNKNESEPKNHLTGIKELTKVEFLVKEMKSNNFIEKFESTQNITFNKSDENWVILTFDNGIQKQEKIIHDLKLTILY